jgi:hypothetical protein
MRIAFQCAVNLLARAVAAETSAGSTISYRSIRAAIDQLTPAGRFEISQVNEHTFRMALDNAILALRAGST